MTKRAGATVAVLLLAAGCRPGPQPRVEPPRAPSARQVPHLLRVRTTAGGAAQTVAIPLEEYVLASVLSEVSPPVSAGGSARRVFEVQAIVARTYALANLRRHAADGYDLCDTTHCQLVDLERPRRARWANIAREAVDATRGIALYFDDAPATTLYSADCGGHRASASDVWGFRDVPYLRGGPDPLPDGRSHQEWQFEASREDVRKALNADKRTTVGARLDTIDVQKRDPSGRARLLLLNGTRAPLVRGEDFRAVMARSFGARAIRSSRFTVARNGRSFVFEGQGFGHGVGLCQTGALARATHGDKPADILAFYFPGTRLRR